MDEPAFRPHSIVCLKGKSLTHVTTKRPADQAGRFVARLGIAGGSPTDGSVA